MAAPTPPQKCGSATLKAITIVFKLSQGTILLFVPLRCLLSGSYDETLKVWTRNGDGQYNCVQTLERGAAVLCCAVWNDGLHLLSGSKRVLKVWERNSDGQYSCIQTLKGHDLNVGACAVSSDGQHLLSRDMEGALKVWSLSSIY